MSENDHDSEADAGETDDAAENFGEEDSMTSERPAAQSKGSAAVTPTPRPVSLRRGPLGIGVRPTAIVTDLGVGAAVQFAAKPSVARTNLGLGQHQSPPAMPAFDLARDGITLTAESFERFSHLLAQPLAYADLKDVTPEKIGQSMSKKVAESLTGNMKVHEAWLYAAKWLFKNAHEAKGLDANQVKHLEALVQYYVWMLERLVNGKEEASALRQSNLWIELQTKALVKPVQAAPPQLPAPQAEVVAPKATDQVPPSAPVRAVTVLYFEISDDQNVLTTRIAKSIIKVGRHPNCHLRLHGEGVGRMHAVIEAAAADNIVLIDMGDKSCTKVNDKIVSKISLKIGDKIQVGSVKLILTAVETHTVSAEYNTECPRCYFPNASNAMSCSYCGTPMAGLPTKPEQIKPQPRPADDGEISVRTEPANGDLETDEPTLEAAHEPCRNQALPPPPPSPSQGDVAKVSLNTPPRLSHTPEELEERMSSVAASGPLDQSEPAPESLRPPPKAEPVRKASPADAPKNRKPGNWRVLLGIICIIGLFGGLAVLAVPMLQGKQASSESAAMPAQTSIRSMPVAEPAPTAASAPSRIECFGRTVLKSSAGCFDIRPCRICAPDQNTPQTCSKVSSAQLQKEFGQADPACFKD